MSEKDVTAKKRITVDDLRHKAEDIRDALKGDVRHAVREETTQLLVAGAAFVAAAVSVAFFLGSRRR